MSAPFEDIEARLRAALAPVEPPAHLQLRLETTLNEIVELAAEELEAFELSAIKDPRNWPRAALGPATAAVVGTGAAVGLVVLRTHRRRPQNVRLPARALREARKVYKQLARDR
ncbi:MAG TPA: hypothetical protein VFG79_16240 [Solirubrobacter sp.]|jgi:hypothetical protein|nr:hypothetical protein [Solirubrobacter sp.]